MKLKRWIEIAMMLGSMPLVVMLHGCRDESWKFRECVCLNRPEEAAAATDSESEPPACHWTDGFEFILPNDEMRSFAEQSVSEFQENEGLQHNTIQHATPASKSRKHTKPASNGNNPALSIETGNCININTADENQLTSLPGVGKGRAQAIVQARTRKPFKRKKDIMRIKGIGAQSYRKMADKICEIANQ